MTMVDIWFQELAHPITESLYLLTILSLNLYKMCTVPLQDRSSLLIIQIQISKVVNMEEMAVNLQN